MFRGGTFPSRKGGTETTDNHQYFTAKENHKKRYYNQHIIY